MISPIPVWARRVATNRANWRDGLVRTVAASAALAALALPVAVMAEDEPSFTITFNDGEVTPQRLEVPSDSRFELVLINNGKTPAEFESIPLRKEKVIAPGVTTSMVIKYLDPGEYSFFDDFHPSAAPAILIAVEEE